MLKRIIARLDIKNGVLVKGIQLEGLRNLGDPLHFANQYYEDLIDEIHYQDVVASLYDKKFLAEIIEKNAKNIFVNISVGGGIRKEEDVDKLLRIGVDKVSINTAAIKNPNFLERLVNKYGSSTIAVNVDTIFNGKYFEVLIETGREKTGVELYSWLDKLKKINIGEVIVTEISKEGTQKGIDIELYKNISSRIDIPVIAHGGIGSMDHVLGLFKNTNVAGVSISSLFHYNYVKKDNENNLQGTNYFIKNLKESDQKGFNIKILKEYLKINNVEVRLWSKKIIHLLE